MIKRTRNAYILYIIYLYIIYSTLVACPPPYCGPCKQWDTTEQECISICNSDECCTPTGCATPDSAWKTKTASGTINVPDGIVSAIESIINRIPNVDGVNLVGTTIVYVASAKERQCCKPSGDIGAETCKEGSTTFSAHINTSIVDENWSGELNFGNIFRAQLSANLHATLNGYVQPTIQAGLYESECNDGCPYGSASLNCGLSASIGANISACVELFGIGNCKDPSDHWTIGIEGNAYIDLAGEIKVNDCGTCGTTSNNLKITRLLAQIKATWMGIEIPINFPITE